ncbi:PREDICTED: WD repeat-containing and planar cell polarity effector protein fritz homolog [Priapulus caudatus]|uniref:WD repeat-containing and planar cell polarity effector protein fritz homolog n=1 Tax=Priapulus caudatus TaxID=37621 RepID=A0ABM1EDB5_PRICU|nr:PREDICTED: WD repeat-containing and planar cell polarity effector protein fritz homolog [Priapulus caudatus]
MAGLQTELHLWTLKDIITIPESDISCHSYHDKKETGTLNVSAPETTGHTYLDLKQQYIEGRDIMWVPKNKRPEKLRDSIKELEELLSTCICVHAEWRTRRLLQLMLDNGTLVSVILSAYSGDVERVIIDRYLVGKLCSDIVVDAVITDGYLMLSFHINKLNYIYFTKRAHPVDTIKKWEKLASLEPKVVTIELPGFKNRRMERKLSGSIDDEQVLVWWPKATDEAKPWSPLTSDRDTSNLVVLAINGATLYVRCFATSENEPVHAMFSNIEPHQILTVEVVSRNQAAFSVDSCTYEITPSRLQRVSTITIPLKDTSATYPATVVAVGRNLAEDRLVVTCDDGNLILYDFTRNVTQMADVCVVAQHVSWHPLGAVFIVSSARGEMRAFDMTLGQLSLGVISENPKPSKVLELNMYFRAPPTVQLMQWCDCEVRPTDYMTDVVDSLVLIFDRGPVGMVQFQLGATSGGQLSAVELVKQYAKSRQLTEAGALLNSMNWNTEGESCYICLNVIVNHLLKMPLNVQRETQLESALGSFYSPSKYLTDVTIIEYRDSISRLARRFFHHLLRFQRFEKAFLLAVDIGDRDLFMDIHYLAADRGEQSLAQAALEKADEIESVSFYTESEGGDASDYTEDDESYLDEEDAEADAEHPMARGTRSPPPGSPSLLTDSPPPTGHVVDTQWNKGYNTEENLPQDATKIPNDHAQTATGAVTPASHKMRHKDQGKGAATSHPAPSGFYPHNSIAHALGGATDAQPPPDTQRGAKPTHPSHQEAPLTRLASLQQQLAREPYAGPTARPFAIASQSSAEARVVRTGRTGAPASRPELREDDLIHVVFDANSLRRRKDRRSSHRKDKKGKIASPFRSKPEQSGKPAAATTEEPAPIKEGRLPPPPYAAPPGIDQRKLTGGSAEPPSSAAIPRRGPPRVRSTQDGRADARHERRQLRRPPSGVLHVRFLTRRERRGGRGGGCGAPLVSDVVQATE